MKSDTQILREAADLLDSGKVNWRQGDYFDVPSSTYNGAPPATCACAVGAIWLARGEYKGIWSLVDRANEAGGVNLPAFNDAPGRTKDEVVAKLRELADALEPSTPTQLAEVN